MTRPILIVSSLVSLLTACASTGAAAPAVAKAPVAEVQAPTATAAALAAQRPNRREIVRKILASNVRLFIYDGKEAQKSASGVVVGSEVTPTGSATYIVTNAHALDARGMKAPELRVMVDRPWEAGNAEPMEFLAEPVAVGSVPEMDLAVVKVLGLNLAPAPLADNAELIPGDQVVVAAAPYGRAVSVSGGLISHVEWNRSGEPVALKTDAPIGYGASGGGVFSVETGKLLAIVEGYRTAKVGFAVRDENFSFDVPMPGETFAAPAAKVRSFLRAKGFARFVDERGEQTRTAINLSQHREN